MIYSKRGYTVNLGLRTVVACYLASIAKFAYRIFRPYREISYDLRLSRTRKQARHSDEKSKIVFIEPIEKRQGAHRELQRRAT